MKDLVYNIMLHLTNLKPISCVNKMTNQIYHDTYFWKNKINIIGEPYNIIRAYNKAIHMKPIFSIYWDHCEGNYPLYYFPFLNMILTENFYVHFYHLELFMRDKDNNYHICISQKQLIQTITTIFYHEPNIKTY